MVAVVRPARNACCCFFLLRQCGIHSTGVSVLVVVFASNLFHPVLLLVAAQGNDSTASSVPMVEVLYASNSSFNLGFNCIKSAE